MSSIVNDLKKVHGSIVIGSNKLITKEQYLTKMRTAYPNFKITDRQYELLLGIIYLVMNTKITSKNTKNYIRSQESSVKRFVESYNLTVKEEEQLKAASVSQNVDYDRKKLLEFFPDEIISKISSFGWEKRIADYEKMLNNARAKYAGNRKIINNLVLNISKTAVNDNLSAEEFEDLITVISKYTKNHIKYVSENLPIEQVGHLNYLVSAHKLEGEDLKRFKRLRVLLEGEEFNEPEEIESTGQEDAIETDETDNTIKNEKHIKCGINKTIITKAGGLQSTRIQYDFGSDIDLEEIDFGDITDADVE